MNDESDYLTGVSREAALELAAAYGELQHLLLETPEVSDFLVRLAQLAARLVPEASSGITMRRGNEVVTVSSSDEFANQLDEVQYAHSEGPCLQALNTGLLVEVSDLTTDTRWADYRVHALTCGVRSSVSIPLSIDSSTLGALNVYSRKPFVFDQPGARHLVVFAEQAAASLTLLLRHTHQEALQAQLRAALASRSVIDQAIGILVAQQRITTTEAFSVLREASQNNNRKLSDIATDLVTTYSGKPPLPPRPFVERPG